MTNIPVFPSDLWAKRPLCSQCQDVYITSSQGREAKKGRVGTWRVWYRKKNKVILIEEGETTQSSLQMTDT